MSSSLPLTFIPLPSFHKSSPIPSLNTSTFPKRILKTHICFTFPKNTSEPDREETRWLREEQRWLREEQRWLREERRWAAERETLLNEIQVLKLQIKELEREGYNSNNSNNNSVRKLLNVLTKEVGQIAESGSSAVPLVIESGEEVVVEDVEDMVETVEEVVVKEVVRVEEVKDKDVNKKWITLRVGSEGDQVQLLQEALLKVGFYCGEEDEEFASFSSGTERAVKTWQSSIGVPETGIMTAELLERLFINQEDQKSSFKEGANGAAANSTTQTPEIPLKEVAKPEAYDNRVYLLGENRWEDPSRLKSRNSQSQSQSQSQTSSKGVVKTKCITCRGEGRLLCLECDGTGEPNIEPQFLEWVGEDTKCPYCDGDGHTTCDACQGTGVGVGGT